MKSNNVSPSETILWVLVYDLKICTSVSLSNAFVYVCVRCLDVSCSKHGCRSSFPISIDEKLKLFLSLGTLSLYKNMCTLLSICFNLLQILTYKLHCEEVIPSFPKLYAQLFGILLSVQNSTDFFDSVMFVITIN